MPPLRVASFQRHPRFDVAGTSAAMAKDLEWADGQRVDLALFPECYLQGYATDRATIEKRALSLDDPEVAAALWRLRHIQATVVLGLIERRGAEFFNTAIVVRKGAIVGSYSKARPNEDAFSPGTDFPIFDAGGWTFGINICFDANFPELAGKVAAQGARLICYPLNNMMRAEKAELWRSRSIGNLQARARETGCWVMSADVAGQLGNLTSYGCSAIVSPKGVVEARAEELREGVAMFDLR